MIKLLIFNLPGNETDGPEMGCSCKQTVPVVDLSLLPSSGSGRIVKQLEYLNVNGNI